jgi:CheY-like chemotaxis protein
MEPKHCWEFKNCDKPCPVRDSRSLFCWRIARAEGFQNAETCEACEYRDAWFSGKFSLEEFIRLHDRRAGRREGTKVLVVDDEPNILFALEETVKAAGHGCISAVDGEEALFLAREILPDLIVSDVIMPKINGYELCRIVKSESRTSSIPVVLVTVRGMVKDHEEGVQVGADAYLVKPFHAQELTEKIGDLIPSN